MVEISSSLIASGNSLQHHMLSMQRESRALAKPQDRGELGPCDEAIIEKAGIIRHLRSNEWCQDQERGCRRGLHNPQPPCPDR
jgi:hypothetical protein